MTQQINLFGEKQEMYKVLSGDDIKKFVAVWSTFCNSGYQPERIVFEGTNYTNENSFQLAKEGLQSAFNFPQVNFAATYRDNKIVATVGETTVEMDEEEYKATLNEVLKSMDKPIQDMTFIEQLVCYRIKHGIQLGLAADDVDGSSENVYFKKVSSQQWLAGKKQDLVNPEKFVQMVGMLEKHKVQKLETEHFDQENVFYKYLEQNQGNLVAFPVLNGDKVNLPSIGLVEVEKIKGREIYLRGERLYKTDRSHIYEMSFGNKMYKVPFGVDKDELAKYGAAGLLENRRVEYYTNLSEVEILQSAVLNLSETKIKDGYGFFKQAVLEEKLDVTTNLLRAGGDVTGTPDTILIQRSAQEDSYTITCEEKTLKLSFETLVQIYKQMLNRSLQDTMSLSMHELTLKYRELGYKFEYHPTAQTVYIQHLLGGDSYLYHSHKLKFWNVEETIAKFKHKTLN